MKRIKYIFLILLFITTLISAYPFLRVKDPDLKVLEKDLARFKTDELRVGDFKDLKKNYFINNFEVKEFLYFTPTSNMQVSEILILKVEDGKGEQIEKNIMSRIERQSNSFKNYGKSQDELLSKKFYKRRKDTIVLVIHPEAEEIGKILNKAIWR